MRAQLEAVVDELKRLRNQGQTAVYVEPDTLAALEAAANEIRAKAPAESLPGAPDEPAPAFVPKSGLGSARRAPQKAAVLEAFLKGSAASPSPVAPTTPLPAPGADSGQGLPPGVKPIPAPTPFTLPEGDQAARWEWLRDKVLADPVCREHVKPGKHVVFGVGKLDADLFFCGEAPGEDEEIQGEPFVGPAGQLLNKIIAGMGLSRDQVYIGNIMNWRPEHNKPYGNRPPVQPEIDYCLPYLIAQLEIVQPRAIVALGLTAANGLLGADPNRRLGRVRGQWLEFAGIPLIVTYHPSYLLRNSSNQAKRLVWEDILLAMEKIGLPISDKQRGYYK